MKARTRARQAIAAGQLQADADVLGDEAGADAGLELVVRVAGAELVLDVVLGFRDLADVVEVAADAHQQRVCADEVSGALARDCRR